MIIKNIEIKKDFYKLKNKLRKFKRSGFSGIFLWLVISFRNYFLWRKYKFNKWHIAENFYRRPYKLIAVNLANSLDIDNAVEVGCGLGEIISRVNATVRVGIDNEKAVITAASKIYKGVNFKCGSFSDAAIDLPGRSILLMTGILHNIDPKTISIELNNLSQYYEYLLLEKMDSSIKKYSYHHDFEFLREKYNIISEYKSSFGEPGILTLYKSKEICD